MSTNVYQEIQEILGRYCFGIPMSSLEEMYRYEFKRSLDYNSLGVTNIKELLEKMRDKGMVVFFQESDFEETHVMCARIVERQKKLKLNVQQLLDDHNGLIPLKNFEVSYECKFKEKLDYLFFGLEDFDNLCIVLHLVVEEAYSGEWVIKAGKNNKLRNMPTRSPDVYEEIQEMIGRYYFGFPMSTLSCLETMYHQQFNRSLDYNSLGVTNIRELIEKMRDKGMVLFSEEPEIKEKYVVSPRTIQLRQCLESGGRRSIFGRAVIKHGNSIQEMSMKDVYLQIQKILGSYILGIPMFSLSTLEEMYRYEFKRSLDYDSLGVTNVKELLEKMRDKGMVLFCEEPKSKITYVMCARTIKSSQKKLKLDVQELLDENGGAIPLIKFEELFFFKFKAQLDYHYFGLKDFNSLCEVLNLVVVFSDEPETKMTYVMCARTLKSRQKHLELMIQELLDENGGALPLIEFEDSYRNKFEAQLDYHYFGLKDFDSLCKVLNLVVEAANSPGEEGVKKARTIYNLRKREK